MRPPRSDLPPRGNPRRKQIADQLRDARSRERNPEHYPVGRNAKSYREWLREVRHLLKYVSKLASNIVLDIGGSPQAMKEFSNSHDGKGLRFEVVTLRKTPEVEEQQGTQRVHLTSVESLRGIADSSVGCVLSVFSIAYSAVPELAVKSLDRVLVPGGVFKGTFDSPYSSPGQVAEGLKRADEFIVEFKKLGYDVKHEIQEDISDVVLAIKPGNQSKITAKDLYEADRKEIYS